MCKKYVFVHRKVSPYAWKNNHDFIFSSFWLVSRAHEIFIRRPSVHRLSVFVTIISKPNARISLKFWLWLTLGHALGRFFLFVTKKKWGIFFTNILIFFIFVSIEPYGSNNFKMLLLLQIGSRRLSNFSWIFFLMVLTKLRLGFLKFWKWKF